MSQQRLGKFWRWAAVLFASGTVLQTSGVGFTRTGFGGNCQGLNLYQNGLLGSVDFCFLLDCQNGFLGGAIKPCGNPNTTADDLLLDCNTTGTTDGTSTTTTGQTTTGTTTTGTTGTTGTGFGT